MKEWFSALKKFRFYQKNNKSYNVTWITMSETLRQKEFYTDNVKWFLYPALTAFRKIHKT